MTWPHPWRRAVEGVAFVNTGSVGRPKDGDWRAGYVLLEAGGFAPEAELVRVEYELERAMKTIQESELRHEFADYLRAAGATVAAGGDDA